VGAQRVTPFAIAALPREPWRNGAGWTRTVCSQKVDAQDPGDVLWRISVADITAAGAFSQFAGMDRTAVMLQGGRLQLSNAEVQLDFDGAGSLVRFPGEWALHCSEPQGETHLLNIMVRRGQARAQVQVAGSTALALQPGGTQVLVALRGSYGLRSASGASHTLQAHHGVHWQALDETWQAEPLGADAALVCCTILQ
jgi:environmental stress-induced protein Ves